MKRYNHFCSYDGGGPADVEESPDGEFVRFDDAMAEIERLKAALEVSQAATNAAVNKARWQAQTNADLNKQADTIRRLKTDLCRVLNDGLGG